MNENVEEEIEIKERSVMIVPIGLEKHRVLKGCQIYPVNVVYLLVNPSSTFKKEKSKKSEEPGVYTHSKKFATKVFDKIKHSFREVIKIEAELNSFSSSMHSLKQIFSKENKKHTTLSRIYINISTASKAFAIAGYVFACQHPDICTVFYMGTKNYILLDYLEDSQNTNLYEAFIENGLTKGPYKVNEMPLLRVEHYSEEERNLIHYLSQKDQFDSIKMLMKHIHYKNDAAHRIRLKRHLEKLKSDGLIKLKREGKEVNIIIKEKLVTLAGILE